MINYNAVLSCAGIALTMLGVYLVYINSPINEALIDGGNAFTDRNELKRHAKRRNTLMRFGVYLVLLGSLVQLISNFIPSS